MKVCPFLVTEKSLERIASPQKKNNSNLAERIEKDSKIMYIRSIQWGYVNYERGYYEKNW